MEIKLPGADAVMEFTVFISKSNTELDDIEKIHVDAEGLIVVVRGTFELTNWPSDYSGKLSVL